MDQLIHTHNIDSLIIDFYFTHDFPQLDTNFDFKSILDDNSTYNDKIIKITKNKLFHTFKHNIPKKIVISLSGGVDSMVMLHMAAALNIKVDAFHIQYDNREEAAQETAFLQHVCNNLNINLHYFVFNQINRKNTDRDLYEKVTNYIRFKCYQKWEDYTILLGHIKNDIYENIFRNIAINKNIFHLHGMNQYDKIQNVNLYRPFLNTLKKDIFQFAKDYQIPYFKDTTPLWSVRGKYRNYLFPLLQEVYGTNVQNAFLNLADTNKQLGEWFVQSTIIPYTKTIQISRNSIVMPLHKNIPYHMNIFWKNTLLLVIPPNINIPHKSLESLTTNIVTYINNNKSKNVVINKNINAKLENNNLILLY